MGLQDGKDVEMRLATDGAADVPDAGAVTATQAIEEQDKAETTSDKDGDIVLTDTTPKEEEEAKNDSRSTGLQAFIAKSEASGASPQAPDAEKKA